MRWLETNIISPQKARDNTKWTSVGWNVLHQWTMNKTNTDIMKIACICVCHVARPPDNEHWHLTGTVCPACPLLLPWQRASVHADGRCDGEGGLEGGWLRIRLHRWLLALPAAGCPGPPAGRPQKIPEGYQETGRLCECKRNWNAACDSNSSLERAEMLESSCFLLYEVIKR